MQKIQKVEIPTIKLSSGYKCPVIAFGTSRYGAHSAQLYEALKCALKCGYRHIDGAFIYFTDSPIYRAVSECLAEGVLDRDELFVTCKLWNTFHTKEMVKIGSQISLKNLGMDDGYIDMLMMHTPMGLKENPGSNPFPKDDNGHLLFSEVSFLETYKAMEELVNMKQAKSIGLANFNLTQLQQVLENCSIKPAMLQIECHPYLQNDQLIDFCQNNGITVAAFGVFGVYDVAVLRDSPILLEDPVLVRIAKKYNKTVAQICVKWCLQRGLVVINKSLLPETIRENTQVFDFSLSDQDMLEIKRLNKNLRIFKLSQFRNHQYYPFKDDLKYDITQQLST